MRLARSLRTARQRFVTTPWVSRVFTLSTLAGLGMRSWFDKFARHAVLA